MKITDSIQPGQGEEIIEKEPQVSPRSQSRRVALQALYQWQLTNASVLEIMKQFSEDGFLEQLDFDLFKELLNQVTEEADVLDQMYVDFIDRDIKRLDPVERAILRIGSYELRSKLETPYKVVINEAVELAKRFGAEESHKFVNGVLDKVAKQVRSLEVNA
ncbi:transcription antitermination factor NusB [Thiomicrorhabdus sp. 6S3-12]|uniref:transcription antitermination factor NusB n=1 Tax=Thiomicrorhabdus sp. 6S3-12 TaxID=2819681 RepID=UPI001AADB6C4|nr:transcription antitermination factor NusB [Thiomicrorhabdus sp. 6S3-12]MBO1924290.1 transcription antitermination factor NusB [Thiomicrorhabdus sp. 6S3-12]